MHGESIKRIYYDKAIQWYHAILKVLNINTCSWFHTFKINIWVITYNQFQKVLWVSKLLSLSGKHNWTISSKPCRTRLLLSLGLIKGKNAPTRELKLLNNSSNLKGI